MESFVKINGVALCVETFGNPADAPVLLIGNTMLTWPDELCARLAALRRFIVRYDQRGTGRSAPAAPPLTTTPPNTPADEAAASGVDFTLRDLVADAAGVLDAHGLEAAHVVGFGTGGWIAQLLALDRPEHVASLTLIATRPTAPGPNDPDLPEHAPEVMAHFGGLAAVDWTDRASVVEFMVGNARRLGGAGFDEAEARAGIERIHDRADVVSRDPGEALRGDLLGTAFAVMDCGPRWRERLGSVTAPTLVVHGEDDPFFPLGNGEALAAEIPGAELVVLPGTGSEMPRRTWDVLVSALVRHTS
ncbi:alpha/beta fold hydrolase [Actinomadura sp. LD22]|uniref:Alpha/beta fold hydrolase n=1 Tax=Actinomadura physcomitrii TaxID=2650748 RepID=A0A6I4MJ08_9ACTN|nr:alpha/beta hydrolase [Actinomadura physcomitrii]MWA06178.1 alpha/beta fold hydrolase [Actinomadura physcomitrii]